MKCSICGYERNADNARNCGGCGNTLTGAPPEKARYGDASPAGGVPTVKGASSSVPSWDSPSPNGNGVPTKYHTCAFCNYYPLKYPVSVQNPCVNCKKTGEPEPARAPTTPPPVVPVAPQPAPVGTLSITDTDFLVNGRGAPAVVLTNLQSKQSTKYEGGQQSLSRDQINPGDMSLSSKEHIQLVNENGQWYINDVSSNQATFVQVKGKTPIQNDTVVVLGKNFYKITFE